MIKLTTKNTKDFTLIAVNTKKAHKDAIKKDGAITELVSKKQAQMFIKKADAKTLASIAKTIVASKRTYQVDLKSFVSVGFKETDLIWHMFEADLAANKDIYNVKTKKKHQGRTLLIGATATGKKTAKKAAVLTNAKEITMHFQMTPPNVRTSVQYANEVKKLFLKDKNINIKVLNKKEIVANKMGLLLSVNAGSAYEPRVVIMEYKGAPKKSAKTALVGKGIVFDAGGYNIKTGPHMRNMKFDMSGSAAVVGAMKAVAALKPKSNVVGILVITDNMISPIASTPDSVWTAMNGKTVEINNTDAEGRLALADGMVYAKKKLKATRTITIATLTGAVISALGSTYTGVWTTSEKGWSDVEKAAKTVDEGMWRLPLHKDYFKYMSGSKVADMFNTDLTGKGGSSSAAMFLSQFAEGNDFIHMDIAGTADVNGEPKAAAVKTLFEVVNG